MWSEPIYDQTTDCDVYFLGKIRYIVEYDQSNLFDLIDLQYEEDLSEKLKEKLFFFQCIISTVLILNVQSDGLKSSDFSYMKYLLKMQDHFEFDSLEMKEDLKYLMPRLQIVMRDFTHEITQMGHTISGQ